MSLSEIAESSKTTPQAVSDMLKRVDRLLERYEENLMLVKNRTIVKQKLELIAVLADGDNAERIKAILTEILDSV